MTRNPSRIFVLSAALAAMAAPATSVLAGDSETLVQAPSEGRSMEVSLAGYDLASETTRDILDDRIRGAAKKVCADSSTHPFAKQRERVCVRTAYAGGMAQYDALAARGTEYAANDTQAGSISIGR